MRIVTVNLRTENAAHSHAEVQRVKCRTEINKERIVHGPGKHPNSIAKLVDPLIKQRLIVRHGLRTYVRGDRKKGFAFGQVGGLTIFDQRDVVSLAQAQALRARAIQGSNRRNACKPADEAGKQSRLANLRVEAKLKRNVFFAVMIVINFHFVKDIGVEREIVRSVGGFKERVDIQDHGDPVRVVKADERIPVGDVCGTIQSSNWSFAVAGR